MRHQAIPLPWWKDQVADEISVSRLRDRQEPLATGLAGGIAERPVNPSLVAPVQVGVPTTILLTDTISPPGDFDLFGINLVAGRTYMFSVYGSGATPLQDSIVALFDNTVSTVLAFDDDGGSGTNSLVTYTATYTGLHVIDVEAYPGSGVTGQYTLDVLLQPLTDVVDSTFAHAVLINPGVSYGFIDSGAPDVYGSGPARPTPSSSTIEAGKFYTIEVAGGADYASNYLGAPPGRARSVHLRLRRRARIW